MTREEAIREACEIVGLAFHSIGDYSRASDGFCDKCPAATCPSWTYHNEGHILAYVRQAVVEKLQRDGYIKEIQGD